MVLLRGLRPLGCLVNDVTLVWTPSGRLPRRLLPALPSGTLDSTPVCASNVC